LQRLLVAEDARGTGADGITPLTTEVRGTDPLLRRVAVRAVGRLQRPDLLPMLVVALTDVVPAIRATAADGIAHSLSRVRPVASDSGQVHVHTAARALVNALGNEPDNGVAGSIAEALG